MSSVHIYGAQSGTTRPPAQRPRDSRRCDLVPTGIVTCPGAVFPIAQPGETSTWPDLRVWGAIREFPTFFRE